MLVEVSDFVANNHSLTALFLFWVGACSASFIGLVVDRLPHQLEWRERPISNLTIWAPRSYCPNCHHTLNVIELTPVLGWLLSQGRCRNCNVNIPWVYPVTEISLGLALASTLWIFDDPSFILAFSFLLCVTLFLSWIDIKEQWLPAVVTTPLLWIGLLASPFETDAFMRIVGAAIGGGGLALMFMVTSWIKKIDAYSGGDVALMACGGAWLGVWALFDYALLGSLFMLIYAIPMQTRGNVWIPMGPALCFSFLVVALLKVHDISIIIDI